MPTTGQQYIPAGRTGRFKIGEREIQVQTEYASRPAPRITTTILSSGEVIRKIETPLQSAIETSDQLAHVERLMARQHGEAMKLASESAQSARSRSTFDTIRTKLHLGSSRPIDPQDLLSRSESKNEPKPHSAGSELGQSDPRLEPPKVKDLFTLTESDRMSVVKRTSLERLYDIDGVEKIYTLDWKGSFTTEKSKREFKQSYPKALKSLHELVEVFQLLPNGKGRENGVYEMIPHTLYMVSHCGFIYLLSMTRVPPDTTIEACVRQALGE